MLLSKSATSVPVLEKDLVGPTQRKGSSDYLSLKTLGVRIISFSLVLSSLLLSENLLTSSLRSRVRPSDLSEVFYLPKKEAVDALSLSYRGTLSDILWFYATSYFGLHLKTDKSFPWLYHYCDLITHLDPTKLHVYKFGALMLAWEEKRPDLSIALLDKAVEKHPTLWEPLYYRGFLRYYFLEQTQEAINDIKSAIVLPDSHSSLVGILAGMSEQKEGKELSIKTLQELFSIVDDPQIKKIIEARMKKPSKEKK